MNIAPRLSTLKWLLIGLLFTMSSCGGDDEVTTVEEFLAKFNLNATQTSSGLYYTLINQGTGAPIMADDFLLLSVRQFDLGNNIISESETEFPVALDLQALVPGLIEGLQLLNEGGRANFFVPGPLTNRSGQGTIPLIFGIEVLGSYESVDEYNDEAIEAYLDAENLTATKTEDGLYIVIEEPGEDPFPVATSRVTVDYEGYFLNDRVFDSSFDRGEPSTFSLNGVIQGWTLGIPSFGTGGSGKLFVPSRLAYGSEGNASIPGNYPIAFDISLISVDN